ncbi:hypothetical protein EYF80_010948 [Liparis tanakae]|uniref:Uncharacterized protein n=1 Tax=Liparis tanakae TaxID=230148 RepID=A0A4Z2IM26_9TELE|nr:hypothetical protein EYF80_010948 [Liparis tanakae]
MRRLRCEYLGGTHLVMVPSMSEMMTLSFQFHRESVTSGRSLAESERHSVPLSAAALPTDWGDWDPESISESIQCFVAASDSLTTQKRRTQTGDDRERGRPIIPFFFEGESLSGLLEGVEVATLGGRTSRGSVGVRGLPGGMMSSESSGIKGVIVVIGVRGLGLTIVHTEEEEEEGLSPLSISVSFSMASELRMTRKWVLSEGVMVTFFMSSSFSFLGTWI